MADSPVRRAFPHEAEARLAEPSGALVRKRLVRLFVPMAIGCIVVTELLLRWMGADSHPIFFSLAFVFLLTALLAAVVWYVSDIVGRQIDRQGREQKLLEMSFRELASIVESTDDAIYSKTLDGVIATWNPGAERLYGYTDEEAIGRHVSMLLPPERRSELSRILREVQQGNSLKNYRTVSLRKDGTAVDVGLSVAPLRNSAGAVIGTATIARDITARVREERELRAAHEQLKRSLAELEQRNQWLSLFTQMAELLDSSHTPEEGYPIIADFGNQVFPSDAGALYILNSSHKLAEAVALWGSSLASELAFGPDDCWALRLGKPHFIEAGHNARLCRHLTRDDFAALFCLPVVAQGEVFALLCLQLAPGEQGETEEARRQRIASKQRLATTFYERTGLSLANLRLRQELRYQSIRDPLTGLFNRSYLEETLEREISRAGRKKSSVGVIMLDIDHFKRFNDTYGHDAGDILLREVGYFLQNRSRKQDIACRYGGEEFTLILPDATLEDTMARAEQLRTLAREIHVKHQGQILGPISFSMGIAAFPNHGALASEVMREADRMLYRAKAEGRDRVVVARR